MTKKTEKKVEKLPSKVKWMQRFFKVAGEIAPASVLPIMVKILFTPSKRKLRQLVEEVEGLLGVDPAAAFMARHSHFLERGAP